MKRIIAPCNIERFRDLMALELKLARHLDRCYHEPPKKDLALISYSRIRTLKSVLAFMKSAGMA